MSIPSRRQNTEWWKSDLDKRIELGAELRGREPATFLSFARLDDLGRRYPQVAQ